MIDGWRMLAIAFALIACSSRQSDSDKSPARADDAPSRIIERSPQLWPGWGSGLRITIETTHDLGNENGLRTEAEQFWMRERASAETKGVCVVELKFSEPLHELPIPGGGPVQALVARRNFSFLVMQDSAGRWQWLFDRAKPATPCVPRVH